MNLHIVSAAKVRRLSFVIVITMIAFHSQYSFLRAQPSQAKAPDKPFLVEYYYKARWGHADEFIRLFKKNHHPVLKKEMELGRILQVTAAKPRYHATEDGRWDYRVTIVWKNVETANDDFNPEPIVKQLYPDQETFKREEQRRF
jgi:hypothetical protein